MQAGIGWQVAVLQLCKNYFNSNLTAPNYYQMKKVFLSCLAVAALATACKKDKDDDGILKGNVLQLYNGKAWTWSTLKADGTPEKLAISISDAALSSVPINSNHTGHENHLVLSLNEKHGTPFNHVLLDWNPSGHEGPMYMLPHFDFHYYFTTPAEVDAVVEGPQMNKFPDAAYIPAGHIAPAPGVPKMGMHWLDPASGELSGGKVFTETFIYGSYDGKVTFMEPMITKSFIDTTTNFSRAIPQPVKFQKAGYYPTKVSIKRHDGVTDIIMEDFVQRQAS